MPSHITVYSTESVSCQKTMLNAHYFVLHLFTAVVSMHVVIIVVECIQ